MGMVFDAKGLGASEKLVMLALADHASEDGKSIYPGIKRLMSKTGLSERTVQATLRKLEGRSLIVPVGVSEYRTTAYEIIVPTLAKMGGAKSAPPAKRVPRGVQNLQKEGATVAPKSPLDPSIESSNVRATEKNGRARPELSALQSKFAELTGLTEPSPTTRKQRSAAAELWYQPIRRMNADAGGEAEDVLREAVGRMRADHLTIASPKSVEKIFTSILGERRTPSETPQATRVYR